MFQPMSPLVLQRTTFLSYPTQKLNTTARKPNVLIHVLLENINGEEISLKHGKGKDNLYFIVRKRLKKNSKKVTKYVNRHLKKAKRIQQLKH